MTRWGLIVIFTAGIIPAQEAPDITGTWMGLLPRHVLPGDGISTTGRETRVVVNLSKSRHGELGGVIYSGQQAAASFAFTSVSLIGARLSFTIKPPAGVAMSFVGAVSDDGNSIDGQFQGAPLKLERANHAHNAKSPPQKADELAAPAPEATQTGDSSAILSRALEKLSGTTRRLLKYTCLETIERTYYSEPAKTMGSDAMTEAPPASSCGRDFVHNPHLALEAKDRLRLEVAVADGSEIHSWAAANRFDSRTVFQMVSTGPLSSGAFGTSLVDIFENKGTQYKFIARKKEGSGEVFEYSFEVPPAASHYSVKAGNEWKVTGYHGSFEVYAATAELAHLIIETAQLLPESLMCRARTNTDYHYALIGDGQFLIPRRSEFVTLSPNGNETSSVTTFSACHEFSAESSLVLDDEASTSAAKVAPKTAAPLPPGIFLTLALAAAIDTRTAAAGDAVSARVTKTVRAPGSNEILIAAGAIAHGRLLQMRHQYSSSQYQFSIRYDTLEQKGAVSPLSIELDREWKMEKSRTKSGLAKRGEISLPPPGTTGQAGGWFAVPAGLGGYVMPAGFESKWTTLVAAAK